MQTIPIARLFDFQGKVALVTGAGMGIGAGIARRFAEAGASVVVADMNEKAARETADVIRNAEGLAIPLVCDVSRPDDADRAVATAVSEYGRLDVLVNNAGIFPPRSAIELDEATWDHTIDVNLKGAFFFAQRAARQMIAQKSGGSIVNIASIDAYHPTGALAHYDASKGGVAMMTRSLAFEWGKSGIRVNSVSPGGINTPGAAAPALAAHIDMTAMLKSFTARIPLGRMGEPDDIACAALFLASPAASYITGATIVVDGGYLIS